MPPFKGVAVIRDPSQAVRQPPKNASESVGGRTPTPGSKGQESARQQGPVDAPNAQPSMGRQQVSKLSITSLIARDGGPQANEPPTVTAGSIRQEVATSQHRRAQSVGVRQGLALPPDRRGSLVLSSHLTSAPATPVAKQPPLPTDQPSASKGRPPAAVTASIKALAQAIDQAAADAFGGLPVEAQQRYSKAWLLESSTKLIPAFAKSGKDETSSWRLHERIWRLNNPGVGWDLEAVKTEYNPELERIALARQLHPEKDRGKIHSILADELTPCYFPYWSRSRRSLRPIVVPRPSSS